MMAVREAAARQYRAIVDEAASRVREQRTQPREGWIATARKALGMSAAQLGRRLGVTRARVSQAEHAEVLGGVTLKTMQTMAEAMGCRFVYAIVPADGRVDDLIAAQARKKAQAIVDRANVHMGLENQSLSEAQNAAERRRIEDQLVRSIPSDFWTNE